MRVYIKTEGAPKDMNPMQLMGKLPEGASARWSVGVTDFLKILRWIILSLSSVALMWFAKHAEAPFTATPADIAGLQHDIVTVMIVPGLELIRRFCSNGTETKL
tara:strand:- start:1643 stop:1954 length:312 start_codon:yes stop_codon:yes gene_type:complete